MNHLDLDLSDPTDADLAALVAEEPLILAELDWLTYELAVLAAAERGAPDDLDRMRLRRAESRVIRETFAFVAARINRPASRRAA